MEATIRTPLTGGPGRAPRTIHAPDATVQTFEALGTRCTLAVTDPAAGGEALAAVDAELADCDRACSRFRPDSELSGLNAAAGHWVAISHRFLDDLEAALWAAALTGGLVDPTVGRALVSLGYDRDFALVGAEDLVPGDALPALRFAPVPGWQAVQVDRVRRRARVPAGVVVDLGATAKARAADRAAVAAAEAAGCGVLVSLGGDLAFAGPPPEGGWRVRVTDDASDTPTAPGHAVLCAQTIRLTTGALATSSVTVRRWSKQGVALHHLIDPRSGAPAPIVWRTASVTAATCLEANVASSAAIVLGAEAPDWLNSSGLCARLVDTTSSVTTVGGWPRDPWTRGTTAPTAAATAPASAARTSVR